MYTLFTEVFPIETNNLPPLHIYRLQGSVETPKRVGGKLAYRARKVWGGQWAWAEGDGCLLGTLHPDDAQWQEFLSRCWKDEPEVYRSLQQVAPDPGFIPSAEAIALFVARALIPEIHGRMRQVLKRAKKELPLATVEREYSTRGWVVEGQPALSLSVSSCWRLKQPLVTLLRDDPDLVPEGMLVADRYSTLKGEITRLVGAVRHHRERLLAVAKQTESQARLQNAPDDELVVTVTTATHQNYDYLISMLDVILRSEDFGLFGINGSAMLEASRLAPAQRAALVAQLSAIVKGEGWIRSHAYRSAEGASLFLSASVVGATQQVQIGGGKLTSADNQRLYADLQRHGLYRLNHDFPMAAPIPLGIVHGLPLACVTPFAEKIIRELRKLGVIATIGEVASISRPSRVEVGRAVVQMAQAGVGLVLGAFPNQWGRDGNDRSYALFKQATLEYELASQVMYERTLANDYALPNIVLGVVSKMGHIPFVLAEPLPYADWVVGIDIARKRKTGLAGTMNATAMARIHLNTGELVRYHIHDHPIEGETVPREVLEQLFPATEFAGKRVVVHRDGSFRGNEIEALQTWAAEIGATFHLVAVIKSGSPRLYAVQKIQNAAPSEIIQPPFGSAFRLSPQEMFVASTPPPFKNATVQPLRLCAVPPFPIEHALHSVLMMVLLHHGSLRRPRLPVTLHYSDKIAGLALDGIKPYQRDGDRPYWL